jgi:D-2-hydroxyacid dehydrogenase (NADP+)
MEIHTCLWNDVTAFDFTPGDLSFLSGEIGQALIIHQTGADFLARAGGADILLCWEFPESWYAQCGKLGAILTPAAGSDWIEPDPQGLIPVYHGTFHGNILSESLLGAILYMNHQMPQMIRNFNNRSWDRDLQAHCQLLANQHVLIIGMGNIGLVCAEVIARTGAKVTGVNRTVSGDHPGINTVPFSLLDEVIPVADHIVLLLPGEPGTDRLMHRDRLLLCKQGAYLYNFGRGNALASEDLLAAWDHLGGAFLDVTDVEPLPVESPLWGLENIMITPHSSCVYDEYRRQYLVEAAGHIKQLIG